MRPSGKLSPVIRTGMILATASSSPAEVLAIDPGGQDTLEGVVGAIHERQDLWLCGRSTRADFPKCEQGANAGLFVAAVKRPNECFGRQGSVRTDLFDDRLQLLAEFVVGS